MKIAFIISILLVSSIALGSSDKVEVEVAEEILKSEIVQALIKGVEAEEKVECELNPVMISTLLKSDDTFEAFISCYDNDKFGDEYGVFIKLEGLVFASDDLEINAVHLNRAG